MIACADIMWIPMCMYIRTLYIYTYSEVRNRRNRAKRRVGRVSVLSLHAGLGV